MQKVWLRRVAQGGKRGSAKPYKALSARDLPYPSRTASRGSSSGDRGAAICCAANLSGVPRRRYPAAQAGKRVLWLGCSSPLFGCINGRYRLCWGETVAICPRVRSTPSMPFESMAWWSELPTHCGAYCDATPSPEAAMIPCHNATLGTLNTLHRKVSSC